MARKIRFRRQQSLGRKVGNSLAGSRAMTWMVGFKLNENSEPGGRERGPIMRSTCRSLKERLRVSPAGHCNHVVPHDPRGWCVFNRSRDREPVLGDHRCHLGLGSCDCSHCDWRGMNRSTLPLSAGHLHPSMGPTLVYPKRLSRCIRALTTEISGHHDRFAKYR